MIHYYDRDLRHQAEKVETNAHCTTAELPPGWHAGVDLAVGEDKPIESVVETTLCYACCAPVLRIARYSTEPGHPTYCDGEICPSKRKPQEDT